MSAVVRRISSLLAGDPNTRILVFSTWTEVLDVLRHALALNGVPLACVRTPKQLNPALQRFREPGEGAVRVLLLPLKLGANGLNITEAQHVVLVEPLLDPAVEAQALGRVHRIGQRSRTQVHSFLVRESIEQAVHALKREHAALAGPQPAAARAATTEARLTVRDVAVLLEKPWREEQPSGEDGAEVAVAGVGPVSMQE